MNKPWLESIEYIRGVSMLGVVAIHTGSQYLMNPTPNVHLVALFEIVSRFSVPIFFFVSAFGLFYRMDFTEKFSYKNFLIRRFKAVLIPYLLWSTSYFLHDNWFQGYSIIPSLSYALKILSFGLAKYHLYFLVILLWFYLLMPLWIFLVRQMTLIKLAILLIIQVVFNFWSSYCVGATENIFLQWRLNWLVLHYVFVFVFGGVLAIHSQKFFAWCVAHKKFITITFCLSLILLLGHYYFLLNARQYTPLDAVNTAHQLSPFGIFYTIAASIFLFTIFQFGQLPKFLENILSILGKNSFFIYLAHPMIITYLSLSLAKLNLVMTATNSLIFYVITVVLTLLFKISFERILRSCNP